MKKAKSYANKLGKAIIYSCISIAVTIILFIMIAFELAHIYVIKYGIYRENNIFYCIYEDEYNALYK